MVSISLEFGGHSVPAAEQTDGGGGTRNHLIWGIPERA